MLYHYVLRDFPPMMAAVLKPRKRELPVGILDRIGIGISTFCLLQCLALPLALLFARARWASRMRSASACTAFILTLRRT